MSKHKNDKIELLFAGKSSVEVTQSLYLVNTGELRILLDCGLYQSSDFVDTYKINHSRLPFRAPRVDAIIISHCNIDHIGYIPAIFKKGGNPIVYVPAGTRRLFELMLRDSAKIFASDVLRLQKSREISEPTVLYDDEDINACLANVVECPIHEDIYLSENTHFRYYEAGHIVKSCQIYLEVKKGNVIKRIGYTGDIGSDITKHYNQPWEPLPFVDVMLGETTYAREKRDHSQKDRAKDIEKIKSLVDEVCHERGGKILVGVFSLDRLQTMLTTFYELYHNDKNCPQIVVDAPLGTKISGIYGDLIDKNAELCDKVLNWRKVTWVNDWAESCHYQTSKEPMIILSSSGMMNAGRILCHLKTILPDDKNAILFCGYAGEDTIAARIKSGNSKYINVEGDEIANRARIVTLNSFSSHACRGELLKRYSTMDYNKIYLVHGDKRTDPENDFAADLREALSQNNKTSRVIIPYIKDVVTL